MTANLFHLRIGGRLIAGFAAICAVLVGAVGYTVMVVSGLAPMVDRLVTLRAPVAIESTQVVGNLYSTLATLRGYLLTGNAQGKVDRAAMWKELETTSAEMDRMVERFTNPENKRIWNEAKALLGEFRAAQDKAEAVAFTPDAFPATKLLTTEAAPKAQVIFTEIGKMIDEEERLEATPERKRLLKAMADVRGNFTGAIAQLRTFLLTADAANKEQFAQLYGNFEKSMAAVTASKSLLTPAQKTAWEALSKAHEAFAPLPDKMFAIRQSPQWNMPVHILTTEAAPRALKILDLLDGRKGADGTRSGGMKTNQKLMLAKDSKEIDDRIVFLEFVEVGLLAVGLLIAGLIAFLTIRSIVKPISATTAAMRELADGHFDVELPGLGRKDEIGEISGAVELFKVKAAEKAAREAEEKAGRDREAAAVRKTAMLKLAAEFEAAVGGVIEQVGAASSQLAASAEQLTRTAATTQELTRVVSSASEEASTNVNSVASATEELSSSINEISSQVQNSSRIAVEAVQQAEQTDARVMELSQSASRIGDVVNMITAIAEQTNLLALNATIEAARAGEAGRGFAVVAQEVKALAAQTAKATHEIGTQISGMQTATQESVAAIKQIGTTIKQISEIAVAIASAVEEQGAATQEIARNVQQAARGASDVATNITAVDDGASQTGAASSQVLSAAKSLNQESDRLKREVGRFLDTVRAA